LSDVHKERKFYFANAETQHLMHKLRGNYNSCTGMCSEDIYSSSAGAQKIGKRGSKTG
jgi:hypothetical protein